MYYEEKIIDGILHWRNSPDAEFTACTVEELTRKHYLIEQELLDLRKEIKMWEGNKKADELTIIGLQKEKELLEQCVRILGKLIRAMQTRGGRTQE
jgi:hypothetical protein